VHDRIAAGELDKAIQPLQRAAELSGTGEMFVRLGEVNMGREDWNAMQAALERGLNKGQLKDAAYAEMLMGVGNLTELTDADSAGLNVLLLGFCQEVGVRSVLTTEVINWCRSCVREPTSVAAASTSLTPVTGACRRCRRS